MIDDSKLQEAMGFTPHPAQRGILSSNGRLTAIAAGRRFGKSSICAYIALKTLLQDKKKIWIVAPTYDLTNKVFEYVVKWFARVAPSQKEGVSYRPFPKIKTARGSVLECRSTENPVGLLGEEVDVEIVDEASRMERKIYDTYLYPVTSSRHGRIFLISTPFGKNWFYEKWVEAKIAGNAFQYRSIDNPTFTMEEWEYARSQLPEQVFKQEFEAQFLEGAASVFRGVDAATADYAHEDSIPSHTYIMGVDLAKVNDFTVLTMVDTYSHKVVAWERFKELDYNLQKGRVKALAKRYMGARVIIDSTGVGNPISEDLRRDGLMVEDFKFSTKSKQEIVEKLSLFIEQKGIVIPRIPELLDELSAFSYQITEHGNFKYAAPQGQNDDCVISLALAVWGLDSPVKEDDRFVNARKKKRDYNFEYI